MFNQIRKFGKPSPSKNYKSWKRFCKQLNFKYIKLLVKIRDVHKTQKKSSIGISFFGIEIEKSIQSMHPKMLWRKTCWFNQLIWKTEKNTMFFPKVSKLSSFIRSWKKYFCRYFLHTFINGKQKFIMPQKAEYFKFKNFKIKKNITIIQILKVC